jgi:3-hydroxyacyl-[acyl-carrier-protein] dehydratase
MNKEQVVDYLPHRDPFLFIDSVTSLDIPESVKELDEVTSKDLVGSKVVANYKVTEEMEILKGHFPGNPILPGVVQVEMMAQASAFVSLGLNQLSLTGMKVETLLLGVENSRFRKPIVPGMELEIHAELVKCRGQVAIYECEVYSGGDKTSQAQILAKLIVNKE